jgi:hypothetical protein
MWLVAEKEITVKHAGKSKTVPAGATFNAVGGFARHLVGDGWARKASGEEIESAHPEPEEGSAEAITGAEPVELLAAGKVPVVISEPETKATRGKGRR